jgi:hypothetical protein
MSGLDHLRATAQSNRPADDGLLGNARCAWGGGEYLSEEAILAAFSAQPFDVAGELLCVESRLGAAIIGEDRALVADLYDGRIGRMWRVGAGVAQPPEPAIDVAFDPDMRQERGDISFRAEDHLDLDPPAAERLLSAARDLVDQMRKSGKLRVRGFVVRAFGDSEAATALLSLFTMSNDTTRSASFSYAVIGIGPDGGVRTFCDEVQARDWTPRL